MVARAARSIVLCYPLLSSTIKRFEYYYCRKVLDFCIKIKMNYNAAAKRGHLWYSLLERLQQGPLEFLQECLLLLGST
jgi:transposase